MYDYLIVGAGLYGSVCAYELAKKGYDVLVVDKRDHIGGNVYTKNIEGVNVHMYGAHIFHTSNKNVWDYINTFSEFNNYVNSPVANYKGEIYNLPFNMNTFSKLWGVKTPSEAMAKIEEEKQKFTVENPLNLEEQALNLVGPTIYQKLIKGYTEKQWGRECKDLPAFIIKRIPLRFIYDNNYFNDRYQGIPVNGYTVIIEKMLSDVDLKIEYDYFKYKEKLDKIAKNIIFTGPIDQYFDYKFGHLEYRSLRFENEIFNCKNYQGNAVVNYTDAETPYTRVIEHKHFLFDTTSPNTVITREYSQNWVPGKEPYYPINDDKNNELIKKYMSEAEKIPNLHFGGRLGTYKYLNMDQIIEEALDFCSKIPNK